MKWIIIFLAGLFTLAFTKQKPPAEVAHSATPKFEKVYPDSFTLKLTREGNLYTAQGSSPVKNSNVKLVWHIPHNLRVSRGLLSETLSLDALETFTRTLMIETSQEPHSKPVVVEVYIETPKGKFGITATEVEPEADNSSARQKTQPNSEGRHRVIQ